MDQTFWVAVIHFFLKDTALFHSWRNLFGQIDVSETYLQIPQEVAEICLHEEKFSSRLITYTNVYYVFCF